MPNRDTALDQMAHLAGEMTEVAMAGQAAGLRLLAAEMQALAHMMPGALVGAGIAAPKTDAETDAETEADFDNMPV